MNPSFLCFSLYLAHNLRFKKISLRVQLNGILQPNGHSRSGNEGRYAQKREPGSLESDSFCLVIRSGLEPETYCLEGSCSIQLSYQTDLISVCGCKGRYFWGNNKILNGKSYIRAVVEAVEARREAFCSLEVADVERVVAALLVETGL